MVFSAHGMGDRVDPVLDRAGQQGEARHQQPQADREAADRQQRCEQRRPHRDLAAVAAEERDHGDRHQDLDQGDRDHREAGEPVEEVEHRVPALGHEDDDHDERDHRGDHGGRPRRASVVDPVERAGQDPGASHRVEVAGRGVLERQQTGEQRRDDQPAHQVGHPGADVGVGDGEQDVRGVDQWHVAHARERGGLVDHLRVPEARHDAERGVAEDHGDRDDREVRRAGHGLVRVLRLLAVDRGRLEPDVRRERERDRDAGRTGQAADEDVGRGERRAEVDAVGLLRRDRTAVAVISSDSSSRVIRTPSSLAPTSTDSADSAVTTAHAISVQTHHFQWMPTLSAIWAVTTPPKKP